MEEKIQGERGFQIYKGLSHEKKKQLRNFYFQKYSLYTLGNPPT